MFFYVYFVTFFVSFLRINYNIWQTKESLFEGLPPSWCVGFQRRGICERQVWKNKSGWTGNSFLKYFVDIGWNIWNINHQVKDGRGLRKFIKETLHATAGEAQTNHTQILSIWFLPDSKDVIIQKNVFTILLFRKNFSRLTWQRWNSLEEHSSQRGMYFLQN